jgi:hypothetical protein
MPLGLSEWLIQNGLITDDQRGDTAAIGSTQMRKRHLVRDALHQ